MMKQGKKVLFFILAVFLMGGSLSTASGKYRYVTDCIGRRVKLPAKIERIACLYAFTGHAVTMLGRGEDIVAVVNGLKRDIILTSINPVIKKAVVPKFNSALNIEELLRVRPDVVFIKESMARNTADMENLKRFHIPCVVIGYRDIAGQKKAIQIMAETIGAEKKAAAYISYYDRCLRRAAQLTRTIPRHKRVRLYHAINEPLKTDGPGMLSADLTARAATVNVSVNASLLASRNDYFAGIEQVILWNPEVIVVNEDGIDRYIRRNSKWKDIDAVKQGRVYLMPNGISRWGHPGSLETPLALLWLVKTIYPACGRSIDLRRETRYFYRSFFGLDLSAKMLSRVLKGKGMRRGKGKKHRRGKGRNRNKGKFRVR